MNESAPFGAVCSAWFCCLSPIFFTGLGIWLGRNGGVRPALNNLLDRLGVPREVRRG